MRKIQDFDEKKKDEIIRKTGSPLILFVGSLVYYKGLEILLQSIKKSPSPPLKKGELKSPPYEGGVPVGRGGSDKSSLPPLEKGDYNPHFLLIGDGPLKNKLKIMAKELEIEKNVHFFGKVDDETLKAAYNACEIFCLPSNYRSEAFGIVQLEAFAAGKPVISCDLPAAT